MTESVCPSCGSITTFLHDHRPNGGGLDDGPWLPGRQPRKKPPKKSRGELAEIRARAWATRRAAKEPAP